MSESELVMLLWIILVVGWIAVLLLAISVFRAFGYAEKKMRALASRPRPREEDQAA